MSFTLISQYIHTTRGTRLVSYYSFFILNNTLTIRIYIIKHSIMHVNKYNHGSQYSLKKINFYLMSESRNE